MSGLIVGLVWELPITKDFSSETKFVALAYADHAWQDGTHAYPSIDLVAEKTGYSERTVQRHVRICETLGVLKLAGKGPRGTNSYSFPLETRPDGAMRLEVLFSRGDSVTPLEKTEGVSPVTPESVTPESVTPEPKVVFKDSTTTTIAQIFENEQQYPNSVPEADQNQVLSIFRKICGVFPGEKHWKNIIDALALIARQKGFSDIEQLDDYLAPFWLAWSTRIGVDGTAYNPLNPAWLTEWAVGGTIPPAKQNKVTGGSYAGNSTSNPKRIPKNKTIQQNSPGDEDRAAAAEVKRLRHLQRQPVVS